MRIVAGLAALAFVASCSSTDAPLMGTRRPPPKPGEVVQTADASKKICRRQTTLGSNAVNRECHTQAEWAAMSGQGKAGVDAFGNVVSSTSSLDQGPPPGAQ